MQNAVKIKITELKKMKFKLSIFFSEFNFFFAEFHGFCRTTKIKKKLSSKKRVKIVT